jgi:hypothetical protein
MCALKFGGLSITFPKEAMEILLCKWVLYVLESKESNLNILFKYMLEYIICPFKYILLRMWAFGGLLGLEEVASEFQF